MYHDIAATDPKEIIEAYAQMVLDKLANNDWEGYFFFNHVQLSVWLTCGNYQAHASDNTNFLLQTGH
jgi:hypothetical protein